MEEQFVLQVPPSVAERLERMLDEMAEEDLNSSLDISFEEDGRTGVFKIGDDEFSASLFNLPTIVESWKTYDDNVLIKTADVSQIIMVREENDACFEGPEYRHGLSQQLKDVRRRRFRKDPELNPELVAEVERDLQNIFAKGSNKELIEQEEEGDDDEEGKEKAKKGKGMKGKGTKKSKNDQ